MSSLGRKVYVEGAKLFYIYDAYIGAVTNIKSFKNQGSFRNQVWVL